MASNNMLGALLEHLFTPKQYTADSVRQAKLVSKLAQIVLPIATLALYAFAFYVLWDVTGAWAKVASLVLGITVLPVGFLAVCILPDTLGDSFLVPKTTG